MPSQFRLSVVCRLSVACIVGAEQVIRVLSKTLTQMLKLNLCWNNIYGKIFGYFKWEKVKEIQLFYQRLDFIHVVDKREFTFLNKLCMNCFNGTLHECFLSLNDPYVNASRRHRTCRVHSLRSLNWVHYFYYSYESMVIYGNLCTQSSMHLRPSHQVIRVSFA